VQRANGIVIGVVIDLDDPDALGRVRVRFPHLDDASSTWARLAAPMAGKGRGLFLRPEKDDEVLVAFEHGDPRRPYVLGALWSKPDAPPSDDGKPVDNNWRFLRSRSGHLLKFDDTSGAERIEIVGKGGKQQIVIDASGDRISIECTSGDVAITAQSGKVSIDAAQVDIHAQGTLRLACDGSMTIQGQTVAIN
jgi:uncharacterized protein involved in type VI secretion and phage assembly